MIKVNNINGTPETIPSQYKMVNSDDNYFYFFETQQEIDDFINSQPPIADDRLSPTYYIIRAESGREFVNDVTTSLLTSYINEQRTFQQIMDIEELLEKVIDKLNDGNFLTAKYKLTQVVGLETQLYTEIMDGIESRILIHYPL
jgi:hypothetical protein